VFFHENYLSIAFSGISITVVSIVFIYTKKSLHSIFNLALGSIVGHEMSHGFDEFRQRYYRIQKIFDWSNDTINTLDKRSECMIEQYDEYTETQLNRQVFRFLLMYCIKTRIFLTR
jgi:predicted metalloendopeptidase